MRPEKPTGNSGNSTHFERRKDLWIQLIRRSAPMDEALVDKSLSFTASIGMDFCLSTVLQGYGSNSVAPPNECCSCWLPFSLEEARTTLPSHGSIRLPSQRPRLGRQLPRQKPTGAKA